MVAGILATGLANAPVTCSDLELVVVQPPDTLTCGQYLDPYANAVSPKLAVSKQHSKYSFDATCRRALVCSTLRLPQIASYVPLQVQMDFLTLSMLDTTFDSATLA